MFWKQSWHKWQYKKFWKVSETASDAYMRIMCMWLAVSKGKWRAVLKFWTQHSPYHSLNHLIYAALCSVNQVIGGVIWWVTRNLPAETIHPRPFNNRHSAWLIMPSWELALVTELSARKLKGANKQSSDLDSQAVALANLSAGLSYHACMVWVSMEGGVVILMSWLVEQDGWNTVVWASHAQMMFSCKVGGTMWILNMIWGVLVRYGKVKDESILGVSLGEIFACT